MKKTTRTLIAASVAATLHFTASAAEVNVSVTPPSVTTPKDCSIKCISSDVTLSGPSVYIWGTEGTSRSAIWGTNGTGLKVYGPDVEVNIGDPWGTGVVSDPYVDFVTGQ